MRVVFTVEVPDEFLQRRAFEMAAGVSPADYLTGRVEDIADDEMRSAFYGWPVEVTVEVHAA